MTPSDWRATAFLALVILVSFFASGYRAGVLNERERWRRGDGK